MAEKIEKMNITLRAGLFQSRTVEYRIRFSKRSIKPRIKVDIDGVEVVLPESSRREHAERMMREYSEWVLRKVDLFDEIRRRRQVHGEPLEKTLLLHGKPVQVVSDPSRAGGRTGRVRIDGSRLVLCTGGLTRLGAAHSLQKHLREMARQEIGSAAGELSGRMGTPYTRLSIRDQRTRWGACSAKRSLSFNWRLVMAPPEVAEYVVIHELAHLLEMNHSARFWKIVEKYCPDYKKRRLWLKKNGHLLRPDFISLV